MQWVRICSVYAASWRLTTPEIARSPVERMVFLLTSYRLCWECVQNTRSILYLRHKLSLLFVPPPLAVILAHSYFLAASFTLFSLTYTLKLTPHSLHPSTILIRLKLEKPRKYTTPFLIDSPLRNHNSIACCFGIWQCCFFFFIVKWKICA